MIPGARADTGDATPPAADVSIAAWATEQPAAPVLADEQPANSGVSPHLEEAPLAPIPPAAADETSAQPVLTEPPEDGPPGAANAGLPSGDGAIEPSAQDAVRLSLTGAAGGRAKPGQTASYRHEVGYVADGGEGSVAVRLTATSSRGWPVALFEADGVTSLDGESDGAALTLTAGAPRAVIVVVTVPPGTLAGTKDETTVTVAAIASTESMPRAERVVDVTTVEEDFRVEVVSGHVVFGRVSPTGEIDPGVTGVTSAVDDQGASYVMREAVLLAVTSNTPWATSCQTSTTAAATAEGDVELFTWRLTGTDVWLPLGTLPAPASAGCSADHGPGTAMLAYDVRLRVDRGSAAGERRARITLADD